MNTTTNQNCSCGNTATKQLGNASVCENCYAEFQDNQDHYWEGPDDYDFDQDELLSPVYNQDGSLDMNAPTLPEIQKDIQDILCDDSDAAQAREDLEIQTIQNDKAWWGYK